VETIRDEADFRFDYTKVMLIPVRLFWAYFISRSLGQDRGCDRISAFDVPGLLTMGVGSISVRAQPPACRPYPLFLGALIVLGAELLALQVAANPYVTILGKGARKTASSRLNLTQAFNSLGHIPCPIPSVVLFILTRPDMGGMRFRSRADALQAYRLQEAATVRLPYIGPSGSHGAARCPQSVFSSCRD